MVPDAMSNHAVITLIDGAEALDAVACTAWWMKEIILIKFSWPTTYKAYTHARTPRAFTL